MTQDPMISTGVPPSNKADQNQCPMDVGQLVQSFLKDAYRLQLEKKKKLQEPKSRSNKNIVLQIDSKINKTFKIVTMNNAILLQEEKQQNKQKFQKCIQIKNNIIQDLRRNQGHLRNDFDMQISKKSEEAGIVSTRITELCNKFNEYIKVYYSNNKFAVELQPLQILQDQSQYISEIIVRLSAQNQQIRKQRSKANQTANGGKRKLQDLLEQLTNGNKQIYIESGTLISFQDVLREAEQKPRGSTRMGREQQQQPLPIIQNLLENAGKVINALVRAWNSSRTNLQQQIQQLNKFKRESDACIDQLNANLSNTKKQLTASSAQLQTTKDEVKRLSQRLVQKDKLITQHLNTIRSRDDTIDKNKTTIKNNESTIVQLNSQIKADKEQIERMKITIEGLRTQVSRLKKANDSVNRQSVIMVYKNQQQLKAKQKDHQNKMYSLNSEKKAVEQQLTTTQGKLQIANIRLTEVQGRINLINSQARKNLSAFRQQFKTKHNPESETRDPSVQKKLQSLLKQVNKLILTIRQLGQELKQSRHSYSEQTGKVQYLSNQIEIVKASNLPFLGQSDILDFFTNKEQITFLRQTIQKVKGGKIIGSKTLFRKAVGLDPHFFINDVPNIMLLIKLENGKKIGGFSTQAFTTQNNSTKGTGILFSVSLRKAYNLKQNAVPITNDEYYIIWGNSQIKIMNNQDTLQSGFANLSSFYDSQGDKLNDFTGQRKVRFTKLELIQVKFQNYKPSVGPWYLDPNIEESRF